MGVNVVIILTLLPALALLPKARAGCGNSARPDLCGGPPARAVPTATISCFEFSRLSLGALFAPLRELFRDNSCTTTSSRRIVRVFLNIAFRQVATPDSR